jgi:hypothetical protein
MSLALRILSTAIERRCAWPPPMPSEPLLQMTMPYVHPAAREHDLRRWMRDPVFQLKGSQVDRKYIT